MKGLIETFYKAFQNKDAETMISCYHEDIIFCDPAFGELKRDDAKSMWRVLCSNSSDLRIEFSDINASLKKGSVHWEAWYTFSRTGRKVHNVVDAEFDFKDSKIIKHIDYFNLHKWATQAFGLSGRLFGRTNFFKNKLNGQTNKMLKEFKRKSIS